MNGSETPPSTHPPLSGGSLVRVDRPTRQIVPLVVASPHSGRQYPDRLLARTALDPIRLRSSEDSFIEEVFAAAPELGAPMIQALFPRVYVDVNRDAYELDPAMFADDLPDHVTTRNARIAAGLGTIAKVVSNAEAIYSEKLTFAEAEERITSHYKPYHDALAALIQETREEFGYCILLDCHSMPSGAAVRRGSRLAQENRIDVVLGDCHATSCAASVTGEAERVLARLGYQVRRNNPYAGGYVTRHYGRPLDDVHAVQIELNRDLYMDEKRIERAPGIVPLTAHMTELMSRLGRMGNPHVSMGEAAE